MRRLISFFHEPDDGYAPSRPNERPPDKPTEQPLYYLALMSYLEERQREIDDAERAELASAERE